MKKRYVLLVALLVSLSAGKANAINLIVTDFSDNVAVYPDFTLREAIHQSTLIGGSTTIIFKNTGPQTITLGSTPFTPLLPLFGTQIVFQPDPSGPVTLFSHNVSPDSYLLTTSTVENPLLVIPEGFNIDAGGPSTLAAIFSSQDINFGGTPGGNISAISQSADAFGIRANHDLLLTTGPLAGHVSAEATSGGGMVIGIFAGNDLLATGGLTTDALVSAKAVSNAIGIRANHILATGSLAGHVSAEANFCIFRS